MISVHDIHSLTDFQRHTKAHLKRLKATGRPTVLTVNGRAELIVQDAGAFEETLDAIRGIQRGLDAMKEGTGRERFVLILPTTRKPAHLLSPPEDAVVLGEEGTVWIRFGGLSGSRVIAVDDGQLDHLGFEHARQQNRIRMDPHFVTEGCGGHDEHGWMRGSQPGRIASLEQGRPNQRNNRAGLGRLFHRFKEVRRFEADSAGQHGIAEVGGLDEAQRGLLLLQRGAEGLLSRRRRSPGGVMGDQRD